MHWGSPSLWMFQWGSSPPKRLKSIDIHNDTSTKREKKIAITDRFHNFTLLGCQSSKERLRMDLSVFKSNNHPDETKTWVRKWAKHNIHSSGVGGGGGRGALPPPRLVLRCRSRVKFWAILYFLGNFALKFWAISYFFGQFYMFWAILPT